jgi:subtilisin family serine protease
MLTRVYDVALKGFSAEMTEDAATALSMDDRVQFVEEDAWVTADAVQSNATWGLDRIDQHALPLNSSYQYNATGAGVHAYIIDSGIRVTHQEFGGRASVSADFIGDGQNGNDCFGHGTHVAGTVGSATYGVAKGVYLHAVRVLDCNGSGTVSNLLAGVNWVTSNHASPAVANISIGLSGVSPALDSAITSSIASGVTYAIAAGNGGNDACNYTPVKGPERDHGRSRR